MKWGHTQHKHSRSCLGLLAILLLAGCGPALTYADIQATAQITGCWLDSYPTPRAVTVTPSGALATLPLGTILPGTTPTATLPTTTPYPRCPAQPGTTQVPWPTPIPNPPPYPTMEPRHWQGGSDAQTTLFLPNTVLTTDLAVHPTEGWPAVASVVWSGTDDPTRVMVSVYQPQAGAWSPARQVDVGESQIGNHVRTAQIAVTGDGIVHVVWGMSDPDFRDNDPPPGVWTSSSSDGGQSWSVPQRLTTTCRRVNDLVASVDGWLAALLICDDGPAANRPAVVVRQPDGIWRNADMLPFQSWYYSAGALAITGEGADARVVGVVLAGRGGMPLAYLISKRLADPGPWQVTELPIAPALNRPLTERMWYARALAYDWPQPDGNSTPAVTFVWTEASAGAAYALTSFDDGVTWGTVDIIVAPANLAELISFATAAYDPAADRLVTIWTCCGYDQWQVQGTTHYASWSIPGSGVWLPAGRSVADGSRIPLALGSRSAFETVSAQASGSRMAWIAWIERQQRIEVRSFNLNTVIPANEYPTPGGAP